MQSAMKLTTTVQSGRRIELVPPNSPKGTRVELIVLPEEPPATQADTALETQGVWDWLQSLPPGPRSAESWEAIERGLQEEKDAWGD